MTEIRRSNRTRHQTTSIYDDAKKAQEEKMRQSQQKYQEEDVDEEDEDVDDEEDQEWVN